MTIDQTTICADDPPLLALRATATGVRGMRVPAMDACRAAHLGGALSSAARRMGSALGRQDTWPVAHQAFYAEILAVADDLAALGLRLQRAQVRDPDPQ